MKIKGKILEIIGDILQGKLKQMQKTAMRDYRGQYIVLTSVNKKYIQQ